MYLDSNADCCTLHRGPSSLMSIHGGRCARALAAEMYCTHSGMAAMASESMPSSCFSVYLGVNVKANKQSGAAPAISDQKQEIPHPR